MRSRCFAACLLIMIVSGAVGVAAGAQDRVPLRTWAKRVCAAARPGVERAAVHFSMVEPLEPGPVATVEEMVVKVITGDELVAGISETLGAVRDGIAAAGVPRMDGGARAVRTVTRDLDVILDGLDELRAAYERFLEDPASDPEAAAAEVEAAFTQTLGTDLFDDLGKHWPKRWTRAMDRTPACVRLGEMLEASEDAF